MPGASYVPNPEGLAYVLESIDGNVGRYLSERATVVQLAAKAQIARGNGGWSSEGNRTYRLSNQLVKRPTVLDGELAVLVGVWGVPYAEYVHTGRPGFEAKPGKVLVFEARGRTIFVKRVKAQAANRFLADNLHLAIEA